MTPEDWELRKALDARSAAPSPEFRSRLSQALAPGRPATNWTPAVAAVAVFALCAATIGVLAYARHLGSPQGNASGARLASPSPTAVPTPLPGVLTLSAPSAGVVWAAVDSNRLFVSADGGGTWSERSLPAQVGLPPAISFISRDEGWLVTAGSPATQCDTQSVAIWHTTDGAASWRRLAAAGIAEEQCKENVWFFDSRHGFLTAWDDNHRPTVYRTADGGGTWSPSTLPDPPDYVSASGGFNLRAGWVKQFGSVLYLEAWGSQDSPMHDRQYVFRSADGGATWSWMTKVPSPAIVMVTESRWLLLTAPGQSQETTSSGQQWHPYQTDLNLGADASGSQVLFADPNVGYAKGSAALERTSDGGAHWGPISIPDTGRATTSPTPSQAQIPMPSEAQLSAPTSNVVWALVGGHLFRSVDQGASWQQRTWAPYQGGGGTPVISFVDGLRGWALFPGVPSTQCLQAGAQLWATSDGAATWKLVATASDQNQAPGGLPFDQCKEYAYLVDAVHGFVAGHDALRRPAVYRTSDGGATWATSTLPDPPGFVTNGGGNALQVVAMRAFGASVLAVAGNGSGAEYAFRSIDSGATWSYAATLPPGPAEVVFVTDTRWLLIGNDAAGQETTDGGKSWHAWSTDYKDAAGVASTFVFADGAVGYGTVRGDVHRTTDGGAHWELIKNSWP